MTRGGVLDTVCVLILVHFSFAICQIDLAYYHCSRAHFSAMPLSPASTHVYTVVLLC